MGKTIRLILCANFKTVFQSYFSSPKTGAPTYKCIFQSLFRIFNENQYDGVFHLAAQSHPPTSFVDPVGTIEANVLGTTYLIDCIQNYQENK